MFDYSSRLASLQEELDARNLSAALIAATDHMRYLVGWCEPAGERFVGLVVVPGRVPTIVAPALYAEDVEAGTRSLAAVLPYNDGDDWTVHLKRAGLEVHEGTVAVDEALPSGHLLRLQRTFPDAQFESAGPVMQAIRAVKSPEELAAMQRSAEVADRVYDRVVGEIRAGVTERDVQSAILAEFASAGAENAWAIVAFGPNGSRPHHRSNTTRLAAGMIVVLDLGGCVDGYQSDITRTVAFGEAGVEAREIYRIVHEAHTRVLEAARPGSRCCDVDAVARQVIEQAGYGDHFLHRTGHGIGMSTHEPPNLSADDNSLLVPGMCFSDEPGVYLPGRFGVRIESIITIEGDGARSLNAAPPTRLPVLEA